MSQPAAAGKQGSFSLYFSPRQDASRRGMKKKHVKLSSVAFLQTPEKSKQQILECTMKPAWRWLHRTLEDLLLTFFYKKR